MVSKEPPVCPKCCDSPDSVEKLEQHADVLKKPRERPKPPRHILEGSSGHVSLEHPFSKDTNFVTDDPLKGTNASRALPAWMSLLPSQKNPHVHPPKHSVLQRRSTFPYFESTRMTTPNESQLHTPPETIQANNAATQRRLAEAPGTGSILLRTNPSIPASGIGSEILSSAQSFLSFQEGQKLKPKQHMNYVSEQPLCPSAYVVRPTISLSRPQQSSAAHYTPSVVDEPQKSVKIESVSRGLSKRVPPTVTEVFPKQSEKEQRRDRPWKLDWSRNTSREGSLNECTKTDHTPEPSQDLSPAKSPFLKELSSFLASRAGKYILPSRISETELHKATEASDVVSECPKCGHNIVSGNVCERCQSRVDVPGGWV